MADLLQGTVAPSVNVTQTQQTTTPQYYSDYLSGLAGAGQTALNTAPQNLVAGFSPLQQTAFQQLPAATQAYQPALSAAEATTAQTAQGITPEDIQGFMNPYTQNVVNEMGRLAQQNVQRNVLPSLKAGFVGTGGLGSQRYANALGQTMADVQSNLTGQQYGALSTGFQNAVNNAVASGKLSQDAAAQLLAEGTSEQTLGLAGNQALQQAGAQQQALEQAKINAPLTQATNVANLLRGYQVPTGTTQTYSGPMAGVYGASPLSQLTSLGALVGSGLSSQTGYAIDPTTGQLKATSTPGWLSTLIGKLPSLGTTDTSGGVPTSGGDLGTAPVNVDTSGVTVPDYTPPTDLSNFNG